MGFLYFIVFFFLKRKFFFGFTEKKLFIAKGIRND